MHNILAVICHRSWLNGFSAQDVYGCTVAACVTEDNTVTVLKFLPK